jgi:hypothetical protein
MGGGGGFSSKAVPNLAAKQAEAARAAEAKKAAEEAAFVKMQAGARPGVRLSRQSDAEKRAGVNPASYEGTRDINTGQLLGQYKFDPYAGEAMQKLKEQAFATGDSPWAKLQLQKQGMEQSGAMDQAAKQGMQGMSQAQSELAASGGLSSGARERMARGGGRDLLMARQGIARQGVGARLGIGEQDINRKQSMLSDFGNAEQGAQKFNIGQQTDDLNRSAAFDSNRYNAQMQAYGAAETARAQRDAAAKSGGGGGCCFIFLEARYGTGAMDTVVRKYRDENMTPRNRRGYYKLAEVLVPSMRKSKTVKFLVRALLTDPLVSYGKWHYGHGGIGFVFLPLVKFWLGAFDVLGGDTEFLRESGEFV